MSSKHSDLLTTHYARDAVAARTAVSRTVPATGDRQHRDREQQGTDDFPWVFDEEKGFRPIDFIQRFCKPSKGNYKRLELQPWQHFIIGSLYGWVHKDTGLRRFKEGLIFVARKNGKSTMVS